MDFDPFVVSLFQDCASCIDTDIFLLSIIITRLYLVYGVGEALVAERTDPRGAACQRVVAARAGGRQGEQRALPSMSVGAGMCGHFMMPCPQGTHHLPTHTATLGCGHS